MLKQKLHNCVVIYTMVIDRKNYVAADTPASNGKRIPQHHSKVEEAMGFKTKKLADEYLDNMHNTLGRIYHTERARIPIKLKNKLHEAAEIR